MLYANICGVNVTRFILGTNPVIGISHQNPARDAEMTAHFTLEGVLELFFQAQNLGVNTVLARTDARMLEILREYRARGGTMQWFAQTAPELGPHENSIALAVEGGAKAVHIHGGVMDYAYAQGKLGEIQPALDLIRSHGMLAGAAAHQARVIAWAEDNLDLDYFMCCYYNPSPRDDHAGHIKGAEEVYDDTDREKMLALIPRLSRPVIHYKILAAGRNDPKEAFRIAASVMRPSDAVCVGIYLPDDPQMISADLQLLEESLLQQAGLAQG